MEDEERQRLRELLRAHQSRLQVLELQQAQQGIQTPAQVITEIADIRREMAKLEAQLGRRTSAMSRAALRQTRQHALAAFYAKEWERAEELLDQVVQADLDDEDAQIKLAEVQRQLDLQAFYQAICDLRDVGNWQAVRNALADLDRRQPGYPDSQGLRAWADEQKPQVRRNDTDSQPPVGSPPIIIHGEPLVDLQATIAVHQELLQRTRRQLFEMVSISPKPFAILAARDAIRSLQEEIRQIKDTLGGLGGHFENLSTDVRPTETDFLLLTLLMGAIVGVSAILLLGALFSGLSGIVTPLLGTSTTPSVATLSSQPSIQPISTPTLTIATTLSSSSSPSEGAQFRVINTGAEGLFLRPDHSTDATPLKTLADGSIVTVIGEDFSGLDTIWKHVRDASGSEGWVMSQYLQAVQ